MGSTHLGRVAVVTGAARGIGKAALLQLAVAGAAVAGIYQSSEEAAVEAATEIQSMGGTVLMYKGSVADREFVADAMRDIHGRLGRLDILINNAGCTRDQLALFMHEPDWEQVIRTNFTGSCLCAQAAIPYMVAGGGGNIVNVVSVSGIYGREAQVNYAASKGALMGLTKLLARRYAADGIVVAAVAPGMIETAMAAEVPLAKRDDFLRHTALGRMGSVEEVAAAIDYLASPMAAYASGQTLKLDGGFLR